VGQERGDGTDASAQPHHLVLVSAFDLQVWLHVDKESRGKLSRTCSHLLLWLRGGKQFPVRYLLITLAGLWGRLAKLPGNDSQFCWGPNNIHFDLIHGVAVCWLSQGDRTDLIKASRITFLVLLQWENCLYLIFTKCQITDIARHRGSLGGHRTGHQSTQCTQLLNPNCVLGGLSTCC
jgi:hypothetical protein